ncbi:hypothetical protein HK099_007715 [Clydaea vesicula]|uniref:C2H2-type domain-containing protein n=1 Tax=Clydaea vesicula TaxID=447962 RepID=A0AAD5XYB3_9FUNG|nr:hypothetical protein HK099_007715 [Clydaea vesicula]
MLLDYLNLDDIHTSNEDVLSSNSDFDSIYNFADSFLYSTNNNFKPNSPVSIDLNHPPTLASPSEHVSFALLNSNYNQSHQNIFRSHYINHSDEFFAINCNSPNSNVDNPGDLSFNTGFNNQMKKDIPTKLAIKIPIKTTDQNFPQQPTPPYSPTNSSVYGNSSNLKDLRSPTNSLYSPPSTLPAATPSFFPTQQPNNPNFQSPLPSPLQERKLSFAPTIASQSILDQKQQPYHLPPPRKRKAIVHIPISAEQQIMVDLLLEPNYTKNRLNRKDKSFPCPCGKQFERLCGLKSHIKVHQSKFQQLVLNEVNKNLEWIQENGQPILMVDESEIRRNFLCDNCPKSFLRKQDLRRHFQCTHSPTSKPLCCPVCRACFSRSDALHRHVQANRCKSKCK